MCHKNSKKPKGPQAKPHSVLAAPGSRPSISVPSALGSLRPSGGRRGVWHGWGSESGGRSAVVAVSREHAKDPKPYNISIYYN